MKQVFAKRKRSILIPILMGSAVGAGISLLLAPKAGKDMRTDLKRFAADTRDRAADVIDEGRGVVDKAVKAGRETYDEGTERIGKLMHRQERSLVGPILASGIIGAGIAILLAAKPGKEVRKDLTRIAANTRDTIGSAVDKGKALYLKGRKTIPDVAEAGRKAFEQGKEKILHAV